MGPRVKGLRCRGLWDPGFFKCHRTKKTFGMVTLWLHVCQKIPTPDPEVRYLLPATCSPRVRVIVWTHGVRCANASKGLKSLGYTAGI